MTIFKNFIGSIDLKLWDGITRTFDRLTSSGGTLTQNKIGHMVDVLEVYGSGNVYTDATIQSAVSAVGSNSCAFLLSSGTWTIAANLTIPANVTLYVPRGTTLSVSTGITLTINGPIMAGCYQIFDGVGTIGGTPVLQFKDAQWFSGTVTDSTTPSYKAATGGAVTHTTAAITTATITTANITTENTTTANITTGNITTTQTNTINEQTAGSGVTADSVLLKDGSVTVGTGGKVVTDTIAEKTSAAGVTIDGCLIKDGGIATDGTNIIKQKIVDIGDWNMDATSTVSVAHGLTAGNIRQVTAIIRNDAADEYYQVASATFAGTNDSAQLSLGYLLGGSEASAWDATNVNLYRRGTSYFDSVSFDSTSYNRGWIVITHVG